MNNLDNHKNGADKSIQEQREEFLSYLVYYNTTKTSEYGYKRARELGCVKEYEKTIEKNNEYIKNSKEKKKSISMNHLSESKQEILENLNNQKELDKQNNLKKEGNKDIGREKLRWPDDYVRQIVTAFWDYLESMKNSVGIDILSDDEINFCFEQACTEYVNRYPNDRKKNQMIIAKAKEIIF